jgi:hypothetical protein
MHSMSILGIGILGMSILSTNIPMMVKFRGKECPRYMSTPTIEV